MAKMTYERACAMGRVYDQLAKDTKYKRLLKRMDKLNYAYSVTEHCGHTPEEVEKARLAYTRVSELVQAYEQAAFEVAGIQF